MSAPFYSRGFALIEIVLASGILIMIFVSVSVYYQTALKVSQDTTRHIQSGFLLEEGLESIKLLRDGGWSAKIAPLSTTTTYFFYWTGTQWTTTTTPQVVENLFTRSFIITDVFRDASDNIAPSGTFDPGTKKVTVSVAWTRKGNGATATDTAETYITNLFSN